MAERTALGTLVTGTGWVTVLLGFLVGSLAPALVGLALLTLAQGARFYLGSVDLELERELPRRVALDEELTSRLTARTEARVPLEVHDRPPAAFRRLGREHTSEPGRATETRTLLPEDPGLARFQDADVRLTDPWGLFAQRQVVAVPRAVRVAPEGSWAVKGRAVGRRHPIESLVKNRQAFEAVPEIEHVRAYEPGDRVRDIDWARSSRLDGLFSRQRERQGPRPILVLLEATPSMRWKRRHAKLTSATRLAYGIAAAAQGAGVSAQLVAFNEQGVARSGSLQGKRRTVVETVERLSTLSGPLVVDRLPDPRGEETLPGPEERAFLKALSPFVQGPAPSATPLESALSQLTQRTTQPALVVAILDAEESPRATQVAVDRVTRAGHDMVLVVPATGAHHYTRREARGGTLDRLVQAHTHRARVAKWAKAKRVPLVPLLPGGEQEALEEVMASAQ